MARGPKPVPADFVMRAKATSSKALGQHYGACPEVIAAWRRQTNTPPPASSARRTVGSKHRAKPEDFAERAGSMTLKEACVAWRTNNQVLMRWAFEAGLKFRSPPRVVHRANLDPLDRHHARDMSRAGLAADFLRRLGPVFRSDSVGNPLPDGAFWRRGRFVLTDEEIIERALSNGWRPDAWQQLAGATPSQSKENRHG